MKYLKLYESHVSDLRNTIKDIVQQKKDLKDKEKSIYKDATKFVEDKVKELLKGLNTDHIDIHFNDEEEQFYAKQHHQYGATSWCIDRVELNKFNNKEVVNVITYRRGRDKFENAMQRFSLNEVDIDNMLMLLDYLENLGTQEEWLAKEEGNAMGFFNTKEN